MIYCRVKTIHCKPMSCVICVVKNCMANSLRPWNFVGTYTQYSVNEIFQTSQNIRYNNCLPT